MFFTSARDDTQNLIMESENCENGFLNFLAPFLCLISLISFLNPVSLFSSLPLLGIEYLYENGLLKHDPKDVAQFLYKGEGLNKTAIGKNKKRN